MKKGSKTLFVGIFTNCVSRTFCRAWWAEAGVRDEDGGNWTD